jgi:hypothetical protein
MCDNVLSFYLGHVRVSCYCFCDLMHAEQVLSYTQAFFFNFKNKQTFTFTKCKIPSF